MTEPNHHKIVRRYDHRKLTASPGHVIGLFRYRIRAVAVDPEKRAVNRTFVGFPGRRYRADEPGESFRQNPLTLPYAVLKIKVPKPGPITARREFIPLRKEVSIGIGFEHHRADPNLVEQCPLWK